MLRGLAASSFTPLIEQHEGKKREASFAAETLIEKHFAAPFLPTEDSFDALIRVMGEFVTACTFARKELPEYAAGGFEEGQTWNLLICKLTRFASERALPTAASKGTDKSASGRPSPFVAFVRELQNSLREDSRRHFASDVALAAGIAIARRRPPSGR
jgi:hypothetical protein